MDAGTFTTGLDSLNRRLVAVGFLPLTTAFLIVLVLLCAGAPHAVDPRHAWHTVVHASAAAVAVTLGALLVCTVLLYPLQVELVRILEGYLPSWLRPVAAAGVAWQRHNRKRLRERAKVPEGGTDERVQAAGQWGTRLRDRFPSRPRPLPTALGNVLSAAEERVGSAYGWDAVVFWPRLYPLLPATARAVVDDRRDRLDSMAGFTAAFAVAAVASVALTAATGWWVLVSLIPAALTALAYRGAVAAGIAYGQAVTVAVDLHRFLLYESLHLPAPVDSDAEIALAEALALQWRQGVRQAWVFDHDQGRDGAGGRAGGRAG